jgi:hypothetical protein
VERLTDEELACWVREEIAPPLHAALLELQRHRSAIAADKERVRKVVMEVVSDAEGSVFESTADYVTAVSYGIADQLATSAVKLTADEVKQLEHHIRDHRATSAYSCSLIERLIGTAAPAPKLTEEERNHLLSIRGHFLSGLPDLWSAELATLDRLLGAP